MPQTANPIVLDARHRQAARMPRKGLTGDSHAQLPLVVSGRASGSPVNKKLHNDNEVLCENSILYFLFLPLLSCLAVYSSYTTTDKTCNIDCTETYYNCQDGRIQNQNCFSWLPNSQ